MSMDIRTVVTEDGLQFVGVTAETAGVGDRQSMSARYQPRASNGEFITYRDLRDALTADLRAVATRRLWPM